MEETPNNVSECMARLMVEAQRWLIVADADNDEHFVLDLEKLFANRGTVCFRMKADAPGFAIAAGDIVVTETGAVPETDDLVVVDLECDGRCVRRIRFGPHTVSLKSGSPAVPDVVLMAGQVRVVGRVTGVIRKYGEDERPQTPRPVHARRGRGIPASSRRKVVGEAARRRTVEGIRRLHEVLPVPPRGPRPVRAPHVRAQSPTWGSRRNRR
jgi:hypothetical protein